MNISGQFFDSDDENLSNLSNWIRIRNTIIQISVVNFNWFEYKFDDKKGKILQLPSIIFNISKICNVYLSLGLQATGEAFSHQKRTFSTWIHNTDASSIKRHH
jgi:hypothetical protein